MLSPANRHPERRTDRTGRHRHGRVGAGRSRHLQRDTPRSEHRSAAAVAVPERDVLRNLRDYQRDGFHPDDHDNTALLERWTTELFGPDGRLTDHLH